MTSTKLHELFDDVTADVPAEVARLPMKSILKRARMRRARLAGGAILAAAIVFSAVVFSLPRHETVPPATPRTAISWDVAISEQGELTVYFAHSPICFDDLPQTEVELTHGIPTISIFAPQDFSTDCHDPVLHAVPIKLAEQPADGVLRDGASGEIKPVYYRTDLPDQTTDSFFGAAAFDNEPAEASGKIRTRQIDIEVRGTGLTAIPLDSTAGERMSFGATTGYLARDFGGYRFAFQRPRGDRWVGYELYPHDENMTRSEFIALLNSLNWR